MQKHVRQTQQAHEPKTSDRGSRYMTAQLATVGDRILAQRKKLELSARAASFRGSSPTGPRLAAQNSIADIYEIRKT
jgi:hypothetical protein